MALIIYNYIDPTPYTLVSSIILNRISGIGFGLNPQTEATFSPFPQYSQFLGTDLYTILCGSDIALIFDYDAVTVGTIVYPVDIATNFTAYTTLLQDVGGTFYMSNGTVGTGAASPKGFSRAFTITPLANIGNGYDFIFAGASDYIVSLVCLSGGSYVYAIGYFDGANTRLGLINLATPSGVTTISLATGGLNLFTPPTPALYAQPIGFQLIRMSDTTFAMVYASTGFAIYTMSGVLGAATFTKVSDYAPAEGVATYATGIFITSTVLAYYYVSAATGHLRLVLANTSGTFGTSVTVVANGAYIGYGNLQLQADGILTATWATSERTLWAPYQINTSTLTVTLLTQPTIPVGVIQSIVDADTVSVGIHGIADTTSWAVEPSNYTYAYVSGADGSLEPLVLPAAVPQTYSMAGLRIRKTGTNEALLY